MDTRAGVEEIQHRVWHYFFSAEQKRHNLQLNKEFGDRYPISTDMKVILEDGRIEEYTFKVSDRNFPNNMHKETWNDSIYLGIGKDLEDEVDDFLDEIESK